MSAAAERDSITVVVVTFNSRPLLADLIESLPAGMDGAGPWQLVVADNASSDGTVELLRELAPQTLIVEMGRNAGYAAGINAGVRAVDANGPVLVLNPDVRLQPGSVRILRETLTRPGTGIAVPRLLNGHGDLIHSLRREPTILRALGQSLLGGAGAARWSMLLDEVRADEEYRRPNTADWASGPAMLLSRECLTTVGPWDESYFLYSEETDFALRARDRGFILRYEPTAVVTHLEGESMENPWLFSLLTLNRIRLYRRRHGPVATAVYWLAVFAGELLRTLRGDPVHRAAAAAMLNPRHVYLP